MHIKYYLITDKNITSSHTKILPHHIQKYYLITYKNITSSHTKILPHHIQKYYLITYKNITSSHTKILPHHIQKYYLITYKNITSSHTKILPHHIQKYYLITYKNIITSHTTNTLKKSLAEHRCHWLIEEGSKHPTKLLFLITPYRKPAKNVINQTRRAYKTSLQLPQLVRGGVRNGLLDLDIVVGQSVRYGNS